MNFEMETRNCHGCKNTFRVLATSTQRYHSANCESDNTGKPIWEDPRRASHAGKKPKESLIKFGTRPMPSTEKKSINEENLITPKEETPSVSEPVITTLLIKSLPIIEEINGVEITPVEPKNPKGDTMMITENDCLDRSLMHVNEDSPIEVLPELSESLKREQSESMNLINSSVRQLKHVLDSVAIKTAKAENDFKSSDINDICKLSGAITGLMKVKVDAVRAAAEVIKATRN